MTQVHVLLCFVVFIKLMYIFCVFCYLSDYKEYHTDTTVKFIVTMTREQLAKAEQDGLHKIFKLDNTINTSTMVSCFH